MTTPFDTQKVRLDLMQELLQVEEQAIKATGEEDHVAILAELGGKIRWIKSKLKFLESPEYRQRKRLTTEKYPVVQFEREPDEGLID